MFTKSNIKIHFRNIGVLAILAILLFACVSSPNITPQSPVAKPTKTKSPQAPNIPESNEPPTKSFSIQNANKITPSDVLEEVAFGGQGGGGGGVCEDGDFSSPAIDEKQSSTRTEWLAPINIVVCGWWSDSKVNLRLDLPDGSYHTDFLKVEETTTTHIPYVYYDYNPSSDAPSGTYDFSFTGESGNVDYKVKVYIPSGSRMYYIENIESLYLYGFTSNEKVRLVLYNTPTGTYRTGFTAWDEYYVDGDGKLIVKINPEDSYYGNYFAVGESSGMVGNSKIDILTIPSSPSGCQNALPSRLEVGKYAYVATDPPLDQRIRENAGTSYSIIGYIAPGNPMKILDGPKCTDGWAWWKVQSIKKPDLVGWTSEGDDVYWLVPCNSLNSCP